MTNWAAVSLLAAAMLLLGPCVAAVVMLWKRNRALAARVEELAMTLRFAEIRKQAAEIHCDELRVVVGQLSARPVAVNFTDEQVKTLAAAITEAMNASLRPN